MAGLKPRLQVSLIGYNTSTIAQKINERLKNLYKDSGVEELNFQLMAGVLDDFQYDNLQYGSLALESPKPGQTARIPLGGVNKEAWVRENKGVLIEIVQTVLKMDPDNDLGHPGEVLKMGKENESLRILLLDTNFTDQGDHPNLAYFLGAHWRDGDPHLGGIEGRELFPASAVVPYAIRLKKLR